MHSNKGMKRSDAEPDAGGSLLVVPAVAFWHSYYTVLALLLAHVTAHTAYWQWHSSILRVSGCLLPSACRRVFGHLRRALHPLGIGAASGGTPTSRLIQLV